MNFTNPLEDLYFNVDHASFLLEKSPVQINNLINTLKIKTENTDDGSILFHYQELSRMFQSEVKQQFVSIKFNNVIALANNKGGVGKTISAFQLATTYALMGFRVLIIDTDAQANLTSLFVDDLEADYCLSDYFEGRANTLKEMIFQIDSNIDLIPSNSDVSKIDAILAQDFDSFTGKEFSVNDKSVTSSKMKKFRNDLNIIKKDYDFIIFDTHPDLNLTNNMIFSVCDVVLMPMEPHRFSVKAIMNVTPEIQEAFSMAGRVFKDENLRIFINECRPTKNVEKIKREILKMCGEVMMDAGFSFSPDIHEASQLALPVWIYPEASAGTVKSVFSWCNEILSFIANNHTAKVCKSLKSRESDLKRKVVSWSGIGA